MQYKIFPLRMVPEEAQQRRLSKIVSLASLGCLHRCSNFAERARVYEHAGGDGALPGKSAGTRAMQPNVLKYRERACGASREKTRTEIKKASRKKTNLGDKAAVVAKSNPEGKSCRQSGSDKVEINLLFQKSGTMPLRKPIL